MTLSEQICDPFLGHGPLTTVLNDRNHFSVFLYGENEPFKCVSFHKHTLGSVKVLSDDL